MALNFLGLGFNFGAKDQGLEAALGGLSQQFEQLNQSLKGFQSTAQAGMAPAADFVEGLQDQLGGIQKEAAAGVDLGDAIDIGGWADDAEGGLGGVDEALGGMKDRAKEGGTDFGRMANSVLGGAGKMTAAMGWVGLALGPVIGGFGQAAESAGGMIDTVAGIPGRIGNQISRLVTDGIELTNSLEGEAVGLGQTARQVGVNMGYTGQNLQRFIGQATGMAMGLNIGADEAARAIRGWDEAGQDLAATGITSARDLARFTSALGVNADVLRNSTMELRNLGAEDEQIHLITSALAQMGRETGDVAGAINELPQVLQMLERRRALGDTPEQMAAFAADTAAAARGLFEFTQDSDRARSMAAELAGTVTESREAFQNMFAGTEEQLPQLVTELAITQGEVDESFRLMQAGPGGLIEGMGQLVQSTRASGGNVNRLMEFMRGRLQQVFGPEMTATLINFWGTMDAETVQAMGAIRGASVDLGAMGREAHTTGRTLDEVFDRMRAGFQTAFRRVARPAVRDFVRDSGRQLRRLRQSMNAAAESGGPLGDVMGTLSLASQIGGLALLPEQLRGTAVAANELQGMVTPLIQAFSTWGGFVETVGSYIALFATEVVMAREETDTWSEAIDQTANKFAAVFVGWLEKADEFLTQFAEGFATFNWDDLFGGEGEKGTLAGAFNNVLTRLGQIDWGGIWDNLRTGFERLFERVRPWLEEKVEQLSTVIGGKLSEWWDAIDWDQLLSDIGGLAEGLWNAVQPALSRLGEMITGWLSDNWTDIFLYTETALALAIGGLFAAVLAGIGALILAPWVQTWMLFTRVIPELWERFGDDILGYFRGLGEDLAEIWQYLVTVVGDYFEDLGEDLEEIWQYLSTVFGDIWDGIASWFRDLWDGIASFFEDLWDGVVDGFRELWQGLIDWYRGLWQGAIDWFTRLFPQTAQAVEEVIPRIRQKFERLRDRILDTWESIKEGIRNAITWVYESVIVPYVDLVRSAWTGVAEAAVTVWTGIGDAISVAIAFVSENILDPFFSALSSAWEGIREVAANVWEGIGEVLGTIVDTILSVPEQIRTVWQGIVDFLTPIFQRIGELVQPIADIMRRVAEAGTGALDSIMAAAVRLFGNSLHDVVGEDALATEEVLAQAAENVATTMETVLYGATVDAIVGGFTEGFARVGEEMGEFATSLTEQFTTLSEQIAEIMSGLFTEVITQAEIAMLAAETAVEGIIGRLRTVTEAQAQLAAARGQAIAALARPADEEALRRRMAQLRGNEVLQAIHHPDWYGGIGGRGGYQQLFVAKMNELRDAMAAGGTGGGGGTVEERRRLITEAGERLARSRVRGQPGLPGRGR